MDRHIFSHTQETDRGAIRAFSALLCLVTCLSCAGTQTVSFMGYQPPDYDVSLVKSLTIVGFESDRNEMGASVKSHLIQSLMGHGYFTVAESDRADGGRSYSGDPAGIVELGRKMRVDAVVTGTVSGSVDDNYTTQRNSKRVLTRYKTVVEYESRPVKEKVKVRVKEKGKWVEREKTVTTVKRVPTERRVPVYEHVNYTERYLHRKGALTVNLRIVDVVTGNVLASRTASHDEKYRQLVSSNEPPARRVGRSDSPVGGLLTAIVDAAVSGSENRTHGGRLPAQHEIIASLSQKVASELADQLSPRQISIVRQLKKDKSGKAGVSMARNGQWEQAARFWSRIREREPENATVWNNLGVFYEHDGQYAEARTAYQQAVDMSPGDRVFHRNLNALTSLVESMQRQTAALGAKIEETSLGLLVASVLDGTLAERLGLKKGDIVEHVNSAPMATQDELERAIIQTTKLGAELNVDVMRAGERLILELTLGEGRRPLADISTLDEPDHAATDDYEPVVDVDQVVNSRSNRPAALGVIIGVEEYRYAPAVPFARHDAMVAHEYFVRALGIKKSNIYLRTDRDATQGEFRKVFESDQGWLARRIEPGKTEVFVYFVGHGVPDPRTQDAYLVPSDGDPNYPATSFRLDELYRSLNKLQAKSVTLVIDACFSGQVGRGGGVEMLLAGARGIGVEPRRSEVGPRLIVFTAAQGNQVSSSYPEKSHGLFTYFWFKGLKGHADDNGDSIITVRELHAYVSQHVSEQAGFLDREQTPELHGKDLERVLVRY